MPATPSSTHALRIIDAELNRAGEGLRVVEDYVRFVLDDPLLTGEIKAARHELAAAASRVPTNDRHAARDTACDVGVAISTPGETDRSDAWSVCAASWKRSQQALRSLEEYGKLVDGEFARLMEALRYRLYSLEKVVDLGRSSRERLAGVRLCVLVDGRATADGFERLVAELVGAGVGMIQLRDKRIDDRGLLDRARRLRRLTRGTGTLAVVNDRADVAAAADVDGVHVGQEDLPVKEVRAIVGSRKLVGVSTHNIEQARAAVLDGANYLGAGPTFASRTKEFADFAGLGYLRSVAAEIRLPTFAIGGINAENLETVLDTGVSRVAVGAAACDANDPRFAARELLRMLNHRVNRPADHAASDEASPALTSNS